MKVRLPKPQLRRSSLRWGIIAAGVAMIAYGGVGIAQIIRAKNQPPIQVTQQDADQTVTTTSDEPSEAPVEAVNYTVPADQPRQIKIAARGIAGFIQKVGVDQRNAVATPNNINIAGWYIHSAKPGEKGVSLIDGHLQGKYNPGIFKQLDSVQPGDVIEVEYGDNSWRRFEAVSVHEYSIEETSAKQLEVVPGIDIQLNLITCGGRFDNATNTYEKRIVVVAKGVSTAL